MTDLVQLMARLQAAHAARRTYLVALDGFGGAGKSTLARRLQVALPTAQIVALDDFYDPALKQVDRPRVWAQVLRPLRANEPAHYQRFDWPAQALAEWHTLPPGGVVIIEGTTALHPTRADAYDLTVWLDVPQAQAAQRGLDRDLNEYHVDTRAQWEQVWLPAERRYFTETQPHVRADLVLPPPSAAEV